MRIDGPGEKAEEGGENTEAAEEIGSESEPVALRSGVEGREPEVETLAKFYFGIGARLSVEEGRGVGLESILGCG